MLVYRLMLVSLQDIGFAFDEFNDIPIVSPAMKMPLEWDASILFHIAS